jgi:hypothetical protein
VISPASTKIGEREERRGEERRGEERKRGEGSLSLGE